ncbi:SPOR domain-containing protein [uncultured Tateyamaria sp.]|uniref:SPOR domain-containing protein n=1 Tax=uncultured Tateyamaria sp. TaxID=455651 RepID=UPI00262BE0D5|nr:SPOR domain-containing protein [uncultured Tateyamaria sp.]
MANMHYTHDLGHVGYSAPEGYDSQDQAAPYAQSNMLKNMTNIAGAVVSLALIAGVSVWGYKLVMRDVSGIPVVRAAGGEMRVRPEEPGGQLARNTGLSVNEVAAAGEAAAPADRLVLAPRPVDLAEEDVPMASLMVAPVQQPEPLDVGAALEETSPDIDVTAALQGGSVEDLVNQLTAGVEAIDVAPTQAAEPAPVATTVTAPQTTPTVTITGPGPSQSRRPQLRPATAPAVVVPASAPVAVTTAELDASSIPAGTRLVQLGAFASDEIARSEWDKMQGRYGEYLNGKDRIIQRAQSGGRIFYRLRAHGFTDLSDARRFCSALVAEGADCIPVVTR